MEVSPSLKYNPLMPVVKYQLASAQKLQSVFSAHANVDQIEEEKVTCELQVDCRVETQDILSCKWYHETSHGNYLDPINSWSID